MVDRQYLIITYRTDRDALEAVIPEPLMFDEPIVKYEFIRMPDSTGFGNYTESGQVIPMKLRQPRLAYVLTARGPLSGARVARAAAAWR